jgi:hypothetical protein
MMNTVGGGGAVIKILSVKEIHSHTEYCRWGWGCNKININ